MTDLFVLIFVVVAAALAAGYVALVDRLSR